MSGVHLLDLPPIPHRGLYIKWVYIYILRLRGRFHIRRIYSVWLKKVRMLKKGYLLIPVTFFVVVTIVGPIHCLIVKTEDAHLLFFIAAFLTEAVSTFLASREIVRLHSAYCTRWHVNHLLRKLARKSNRHTNFKQVCCMDGIIL